MEPVTWFQKALVSLSGELDLVVVLLGAVVSWLVVRHVVVRGINLGLRRTKNRWDDAIIEHRVLEAAAWLAPILVVYFGAKAFPPVQPVAERASQALAFVVIVVVADRLLSAGLSIYNQYPISRKRPLKGWIQIVKIFLYTMGGITALCVLIDQSPWALLSGVGAMTAVLLLIFRDTILSLVASLQLVSNDMVHVGDWIEMPKYEADGDVIEIALHTVKVQNWDKTITTIPTHKLVEESFKNWRGMAESGGRRIKRAIYIDQSSIRFCDDDLIRRLSSIQILRPYIETKLKELEEYNKSRGVDDTQPVNGRRMTNIGTFRAYCVAYLKEHPKIRKDMTFLVRQLPPTPQGLPLEIYVFTNDTVWANYEGIQADIFDHLLASIPEFDLKVFQKPSGFDVRSLIQEKP